MSDLDELAAAALAPRRRIVRASPPPVYLGLRVASVMMLVMSVVYGIGGAVLFMASVGGIVSATGSEHEAPLRVATVFTFSAGVTMILFSVALFGLSSACTALRDIAQNSFRDKF